MKEQTAYLIILSFMWIDAASPEKVSEMPFPDKEFGRVPGHNLFSDRKLVHKMCIVFGQDYIIGPRCRIIERSPLNGSLVRDCSLDIERYINTSVLSIGNDNLILKFKDDKSKNKVVTVDLVRDCLIEETILHVDIPVIKYIVFEADKYYVIFKDARCLEFFCTVILDRNGTAVGKVSALSGVYKDSDIRTKIIGNKGLLLREYRYLEPEVRSYYLPFKGFNRVADFLFSTDLLHRYSISVAENKIGYCRIKEKIAETDSNKVACEQYNVDDRRKIMDIEILHPNPQTIKTVNVDNGLFATIGEIIPGRVNHSIVHVDESNQSTLISIDLMCYHAFIRQNFYKRSNGEYCVNYVCLMYPFYPTDIQFRKSKCFKVTNLI